MSNYFDRKRAEEDAFAEAVLGYVPRRKEMTREEAEQIWMANQAGTFRGSQSELAQAVLQLTPTP